MRSSYMRSNSSMRFRANTALMVLLSCFFKVRLMTEFCVLDDQLLDAAMDLEGARA